MQRKSLVGQRFGKLKVTKMIYGEVRGNRARTRCECMCDCGNTTIVLYDKLMSGSKMSCGCDTSYRKSESQKKDLTGRRFNRLVVTNMLWQYKPSKAACLCDCGNEIVSNAADLVNGHTQSCGCLQREMASSCNIKDWCGITSPYGIKLLEQSRKNKAGQWAWKCECGLCHNIFEALPARVMNGHITSCGCRIQSAREQLIDSVLQKLNVDYVSQYKIPECKNRYVLRFDFALFSDTGLIALIEYDGKQHTKPINHFGGVEGYSLTKKRDKIKNDYCRENNIRLLRLPYTLSDDEIKQKIVDIIYP